MLAAAVSWGAAGYDLGEVRTALAIGDGAKRSVVDVYAHARAGALVLAAQLVCAACVALAFVPWLYQMRVNVRALGMRRLRYGREWTYLGPLLPGLNLFRPCQVVSEVWRASDPESGDPVGWRNQHVSPLVYAWWGCLVAWIAAEVGSALLLQRVSGVSQIQLGHLLALAGDVCAALSASLGYFLVIRLWQAQQEKRAAARPGNGAATGN